MNIWQHCHEVCTSIDFVTPDYPTNLKNVWNHHPKSKLPWLSRIWPATQYIIQHCSGMLQLPEGRLFHKFPHTKGSKQHGFGRGRRIWPVTVFSVWPRLAPHFSSSQRVNRYIICNVNKAKTGSLAQTHIMKIRGEEIRHPKKKWVWGNAKNMLIRKVGRKSKQTGFCYGL